MKRKRIYLDVYSCKKCGRTIAVDHELVYSEKCCDGLFFQNLKKFDRSDGIVVTWAEEESNM